MGRAADLLKRLEVKPTDDEYETIETSRWGNRDVYPIAHDKRTYGVYAYVSYWGKLNSPLEPSQTYTSARHMRHLPLVVDDRQFAHWHRTDGCAGHDGRDHRDADCVRDSVPERDAGRKASFGLWHACAVGVWAVGVVFLHHVECVSVVCVLCTLFHPTPIPSPPEN
jgi:hypothetical protein